MKHKIIETWAIKKNGLIYYACEQFFGIQRILEKPIKSPGVKIVADSSEQIISGHCLEDDTIPESWKEIAQQLYAMAEGWAEV